MFMENISNKFNVGDVVTTNNDRVGRIVDVERSIDLFTNKYIYRYNVLFDRLEPLWFREDDLELHIEKVCVEELCETPNNIIQNSATRPCYYLEEKAVFHRWVDETKMIVKFSEHLKMDAMWKLKNLYEDIGLLAVGMDAIPVITTFALIEVADGSMKKVPPEEIRFITECQRGDPSDGEVNR